MTAKELYDKMLHENDEATTTEMMVEFARIKVNEALEKASKSYSQDKDSILNSYPLELIKQS